MVAKKPAKKVPAKRKPAKRKPVAPKPVASSIDWKRYLTIAVAAIVMISIGAAGGVWSAGGWDISPDNKPVPVPTPEPVKSFRVIFVKESGQTLSAGQSAIPGAKEIRDYLTAKTTQEGNQPGWREYDPQQQTTNEQPTMRALWEAVKPKLLPAPCMVIELNGKATVMPFPTSVAEAVETLKKSGGA